MIMTPHLGRRMDARMVGSPTYGVKRIECRQDGWSEAKPISDHAMATMGFASAQPILWFYRFRWLLSVILQAQFACHGHAAYVVDARIDDAFAFDLDQNRGSEFRAIELAHGEGEIGAFCIRAREELRSQF